ncbi:hypothetical protein [Vibrio alfacsensis]|uniref:hypothetical protein n=1 Tax=Vibrio alfacsensis TaxID=1074311 RepID=UPI0040698FF7
MKRNIELLGHRRALSWAELTFTSCFVGWHLAELKFPLESGWRGYAGLFFISALVYGYKRVTNESNLAVVQGKVLFQRQLASLTFKQQPLIGPSILIKSSFQDA